MPTTAIFASFERTCAIKFASLSRREGNEFGSREMGRGDGVNTASLLGRNLDVITLMKCCGDDIPVRKFAVQAVTAIRVCHPSDVPQVKRNHVNVQAESD